MRKTPQPYYGMQAYFLSTLKTAEEHNFTGKGGRKKKGGNKDSRRTRENTMNVFPPWKAGEKKKVMLCLLERICRYVHKSNEIQGARE